MIPLRSAYFLLAFYLRIFNLSELNLLIIRIAKMTMTQKAKMLKLVWRSWPIGTPFSDRDPFLGESFKNIFRCSNDWLLLTEQRKSSKTLWGFVRWWGKVPKEFELQSSHNKLFDFEQVTFLMIFFLYLHFGHSTLMTIVYGY